MAIHHQPVMLCLTCSVQGRYRKSIMLSKSLTNVYVCVWGGGGGGGVGAFLMHYGGGFTSKGSNILLGHQRKLCDQVYSCFKCVKRLCLGCVDELLAA